MKKIFKKRFIVEGLNLSRAITELQKEGVDLFEIKFLSQKRITFCSYVKDCDKVVAYLEKKCYNITNIEKMGVFLPYDFFKRHLVSLLMIFLCITALGITGNFCVFVEIHAPDGIVDKVAQAVEDAGVTKGVSKRKISLDAVENAVCVALPEIKYAFAKFSGSKLIVRVEMRTVAEPPTDNTQRRDLVADSSGVVERILVLNGTPMVEVGDVVQQGQILIKGETIFADGTTATARATGEVWATTEIVESVRFCPTTTELMPTGNSLKRYRIKFGKYTSEYSHKVNYLYFQSERSTARIFPLGIVVEYEKVYELHPVQKQWTLEEVLPQLQLQAYERLKTLLTGKQYDGVVYSTKRVYDDLFVTATAKITRNIAIGG